MTAQIANILKTLLAQNKNEGTDSEGQPLRDGLLYILKLAGLVVVANKVQPTDIAGAFAVTKFPISLDSDYAECINSGCYKDLVPNSKMPGILYFEEISTTPGKESHGSFTYLTKLRLVCWINNKLIQGDNCMSISHKLITHIRSIIERPIFNMGDFNRIHTKAYNVSVNDPKLFSRYSYPIESVQFLMHPYEAFGIDFNIEYSVSSKCIDAIVLNPALC